MLSRIACRYVRLRIMFECAIARVATIDGVWHDPDVNSFT